MCVLYQEDGMKKSSIAVVAGIFMAAMIVPLYSAKPKITTNRTGNTEVIECTKDGKIEYRLVYTYEGDLKTRGEYWEYLDPKKKDEKAKSNIFAGTSFAKKYETTAVKSKTADTSGVVLNVQKDNLVLTFVKIVQYNVQKLPSKVMARGYTSYPVAGSFELKTDYEYSYDAKGNLSKIVETNLNLDSFLLNMGVGNTTIFDRDADGRPVKVTKKLGSVPPADEYTDYTYSGTTPNMQKTVYLKCAIDTSKGAIAPSETITVTYNDGVPWNGSKKYEFSIGGKTVSGITIYDEVNKKKKLDASNFKKKSKLEQIMLAKQFYDLYKNESKGPKWRMGELPDVPDPFMMYNDNGWWQ
jgi:hypothetical protein